MKPKTHLSADLPRLAQQNRNEPYADRLSALARLLPSTEKRSFDRLLGSIVTSEEYDQIFYTETLDVLKKSGFPFQQGVGSVFFEGPSFLGDVEEGQEPHTIGFLIEKQDSPKGMYVSYVVEVPKTANLHKLLKQRKMAPGIFYNKENDKLYEYHGGKLFVSFDPNEEVPFRLVDVDGYVIDFTQHLTKHAAETDPTRFKEIVASRLVHIAVFATRLLAIMHACPELHIAKDKPAQGKNKAPFASVPVKRLTLTSSHINRFKKSQDTDDLRRILGLPELRQKDKMPISDFLYDFVNQSKELQKQNATAEPSVAYFLDQLEPIPVSTYNLGTFNLVQKLRQTISEEYILKIFKEIAQTPSKFAFDGPYISPTGYNLNKRDPDFVPQVCSIVEQTPDKVFYNTIHSVRFFESLEPSFVLNKRSPPDRKNIRLVFNQQRSILRTRGAVKTTINIDPSWPAEKIECANYGKFLAALCVLRAAALEIVDGAGIPVTEATTDDQQTSTTTPKGTRKATFQGILHATIRNATDPNHRTRINLTKPKRKRRILGEEREFVLSDVVQAWEQAKELVRKKHGHHLTRHNHVPIFQDLDVEASSIFGDHISTQISYVKESTPIRKNDGTYAKPRRDHWRAVLVYREDDPIRYGLRKAAYELIAIENPKNITIKTTDEQGLVLQLQRDAVTMPHAQPQMASSLVA